MRVCAAAALALLVASSARAEDAATCVDVQIGTVRHYDCLNRLLRRSVPPLRAPAAPVPLPWDATTTPSYAVGGFNQQATQQMLGSNFGRSTVPQRPADSLPPAPLARGGR